MAYRTFEHTADVGIEVEAEDLPALFREAARAFRELSVSAEDLEPTAQLEEFSLEARDLPGLLVAWLEELLFLWDARGVILVDVEAELDPPHHVRGRGRRARLRAGGAVEADIKAVTWHGLRVEPAEAGWSARVIFDI